MVKIEFKCNVDDTSLHKRMDEYEVYLNIIGSFEILINERLFYSDEVHPVVEFIVQLSRWLENPDSKNFEYISLDDEGVLLIIQERQNMFYIASRNYIFNVKDGIPKADLTIPFEKYANSIEHKLRRFEYRLNDSIQNQNLQST